MIEPSDKEIMQFAKLMYEQLMEEMAIPDHIMGEIKRAWPTEPTDKPVWQLEGF